MTDWITTKVLDNRQWRAGLHSLRIEVDLSPFRAGQFTRLALNIEGERIARPYSICSAPGENVAEFYFNIVKGGPLSPRLAMLQRGDEVEVALPANGFLTVEELPTASDLWMISTGTGLGPFISILRSEIAWKKFHRLILIHGVRTADELAYAGFIKSLAQRRPGKFQFVPFLSREPAPVTGLDGRIPAAIADGRMERIADTPFSAVNSQVMLCGNLGMIKDASEELNHKGLIKNLRRKPGQITSEKYF